MRDEKRYIGNRRVWGGMRPFGLSPADRRQHLYAIGKTGTGKSTLLKNLLIQDIQAGEGVALIDPHGDLAEEILNFIPPTRTEDVVYFNPADQEYPIGLNLLHAVPSDARHLVASGIVGAFKSIWRDSWGPRLEYILYACVAALLYVENATLLGVQRMLTDDTYRRWVVRQVKDAGVRSFWTNEFENYDKRFRSEIISPIQNKVGQLLMASPVRNILGQVRSKIGARFMMDKESAERYRRCQESWEHLHLILCRMNERERAVLQSLFFRDVHHILALYLFHLQSAKSELTSAPTASATPIEFSEWLFELPQAKS